MGGSCWELLKGFFCSSPPRVITDGHHGSRPDINPSPVPPADVDVRSINVYDSRQLVIYEWEPSPEERDYNSSNPVRDENVVRGDPAANGHNRQDPVQTGADPNPEQENAEQVPVSFRLSDMEAATKDWDTARIIGKGGFGWVYKGTLAVHNGFMEVAIKRLSKDSTQGQLEWEQEINILGSLRHLNLVRLRGYCAELGEGLLVYDYLPHGSVQDHLFPRNSSQTTLDWPSRRRIARGCAVCLEYLHTKGVIHRDLKGDNILLTDATPELDDLRYMQEMEPVLTDFGLARLLEAGESHRTTKAMGTFGYLDPTYFETGHLTLESDIYSYGIVLLELLTGRHATSLLEINGTEMRLNLWPTENPRMWQNNFVTHALDRCLTHECNTRKGELVFRKHLVLIELCLQRDRRQRPTAESIVAELMKLSFGDV